MVDIDNNKDNKPKKEKPIDIGRDIVDGAADFVANPSKRKMVYQAIGWGVDAIKNLVTGTVYILGTVAAAGRKAWPTVKAMTGATLGFAARATENYRTNLGNNFSTVDQIGNKKFKWPSNAKQWWQTLALPTGVFAGLLAANMTFFHLPWVAVADSKDDPIYLMTKPQAKQIAGEREWTVTCEYLSDEREEDANCAFSLPDNSWLDFTYRVKNPLSVSNWFTGYSPRNHAAAPMLSADSQYCAINSVFDKPIFGAEQNLPPIYRAPICHEDLDELKKILTTPITDKEGNIVREAGEIIEEDGNLWYRAPEQASWVSGAIGSIGVGLMEAWDSASTGVGNWIDEITAPDPEEEAPAEDGKKKNVAPTTEGDEVQASIQEFNAISNAYAYNAYPDVKVTATVSTTAAPAMKVA